MQKNHYFQNPPASDQYSLWEVPSDGDPGQRLQLDRFEGNLGRFFAANFVRAAFDNLLTELTIFRCQWPLGNTMKVLFWIIALF